jgi:hypothetical protein
MSRRKVKNEWWWQDKEFIEELDRRNAAMESGEDKGVTVEELCASIEMKLKAIRAAETSKTQGASQ